MEGDLSSTDPGFIIRICFMGQSLALVDWKCVIGNSLLACLQWHAWPIAFV